MSVIIGIDTGGTFTDFILFSKGEVVVHKVLSTPDDPARAILEGLRSLIKDTQRVSVTYGTTVATNALLERKGARVAFVTTKGFEDLIEIGRQNRPELYALEPRKPSPLVSRPLRMGIDERVLANGRVMTPLSRREIQRVKEWIRKSKLDSIAVGFLHSYRNPAHEKSLGKALQSLEVPVSLSHVVLPEYREYERFSTTTVNAYVTPVISGHMMNLQRALKSNVAGLVGDLRVMQSNGGAMTLRSASEHPVHTLLSGPAGGVVAAHELALRAGVKKVISLDMGGTSTDVCLVNEEIPMTPEKLVAGVPVKVPMVDIHTVGAGGGSIARLDEGGALKVGPESAGADPGPVCYGRGSRLTVTDANLVLGRLNRNLFLGGRMTLNLERTTKSIAQLARIAKLRPRGLAWGILRVVNSNMERAIRVVSLDQGLDPAAFTLVAFGGAGGLHAAELAEQLKMSRVIIPPKPGVLSAWGMAVSPLVKDYSQSVLESTPDFNQLSRSFSSLTARGLRDMKRAGFKINQTKILRSVDMRYLGQAYEINLPWDRRFIRRFHQLHQARFGHCDPYQAVEVVTLRVRIQTRKVPTPSRRLPLKRGNG
ncbi:MAG: hydantoinase/oxoprolinase family protein, partial [Deltaproteobacteria bacterium]|nr:hydantoinase/oxoprolinase family protein [Deltaproteobacteria bacterium]